MTSVGMSSFFYPSSLSKKQRFLSYYLNSRFEIFALSALCYVSKCYFTLQFTLSDCVEFHLGPQGDARNDGLCLFQIQYSLNTLIIYLNCL